MNDRPLETLVEEARSGNRASLEDLVRRVQPRVYALAVRMLWHPEDAADATQEILVRLVTHLGSFRGDSAFLTWAYRVASNCLLTCRASRLEQQELTFERFGEDLAEGLADAPAVEWPADEAVLLEEVKVGCMLALLTCVDREHRLAYILGEIFEIAGPEAAAILGITPAAFRQRLARARAELVAFLRRHCGLVEPSNACRCARRLPAARRLGRVRSDALCFANAQRASAFPELLQKVRALDTERRVAALYRSHSEPDAGPQLLARLDAILDSR